MAQAYFRIYIGFLPAPGVQTSFTLIQEVNKHEVAQIVLQDTSYSPTLYRTGVPIRVEYGYTPTAMTEFHGYINDSKQTISSNKRNVTLTCIGTSYVLTNKQVKVWGNVSGSYIAKTVALQHKLTPYVQPNSYVFPNYTQTNSTFGALTWLAERLGYTTYVNGTGLFFYDPATPILAGGYQIPTFSFPLHAGLFGSLISFHPQVGDMNTKGADRAQRQATGLDLFQKTLIGSKTAIALDVAFNKNYQTLPQTNEFINQPLGNLGTVNQALNAADQANRFWVQADAQVWGDPRVHQGAYVSLVGVDATHAGLWYVQKATHELRYVPTTYLAYSYKIDMSLGRDQVGGTSFSIPQEWINAKRRPPTVFVNGGWHSSWSTDNSLIEC